ncbi:GntR family transcriptional regulator [Allomesorhizobium camelthorni]|uniref:GntR family transcriptional regulator n=1 Tax=Allomesorhizobium camelthorni TaxID=475069 RepID=A0A6G4WG38_9HYPH|nr:GntR family transcriptional regulator [Mesorhizobium camelthorni]NGO53721.1 GntR family transcriptional regulator [Mesorhizobium camelthorni]
MEAISPSKSLVDKTYGALLDAICTGEFRPGQRLGQDEIAERLKVSRQPVNSAIAMLRAQRFVIDTGRRGVEVAPVDAKLFESIYQVRGAIEPLAVELATPRLSPGSITRGREIVARGTRLMHANDARGVLQADIDFHTLIYELSGNEIITDMMQLNWGHLRRSMGEVLRFPGMTLQVWKEHKAIFKAMSEGSASVAADLMRQHIVNAPRRVASGTAPAESSL